MGGRIFLLVAALLLAAPSVYAQAGIGPGRPGPEPCYCVASSGDGVPYGVPGRAEPEQCTGLRVAYQMKDVDKKAKLTEKTPQPEYTEAARENKVEGVVRLRVVLCPSGSVSNVTVIKGLPDGLTERAILAAKKIKFEPAEKDGERVAQFAVLEYNFRL